MTPSWRRPVDPYLTGGSGQSNKNGHSAWSHWKPSINKATPSRDSPDTPSSSEVGVFGGGSSSVWFVKVQSRDVADGLKKTTAQTCLSKNDHIRPKEEKRSWSRQAFVAWLSAALSHLAPSWAGWLDPATWGGGVLLLMLDGNRLTLSRCGDGGGLGQLPWRQRSRSPPLLPWFIVSWTNVNCFHHWQLWEGSVVPILHHGLPL